jgi:hypothetical protein
VRPLLRLNRVLLRCLTVGALALAATGLHANDVRFSHSLSAEDRSAAGLPRLSSDEVAVIDALVRRDTATRGAPTPPPAEAAAPASFSQRLTADERRAAGFAKLTAAELPKLDAFVDRHQNARLARSLLAPPTYVARSPRIVPTEKKKEREIHGSFSLSYGLGSGGYSEKTGSMVLTLEDPDRGYSISVGYSESHIKGGPGYIYRDPTLYRDPIHDPLRGGPMDSVAPFRP